MRAERRRKELVGTGEHVGAQETLAAMVARDEYDSSRAVSPLRQADDAVVVDTSEMSIDEVVGEIVRIVREAGIRPEQEAGRSS